MRQIQNKQKSIASKSNISRITLSDNGLDSKFRTENIRLVKKQTKTQDSIMSSLKETSFKKKKNTKSKRAEKRFIMQKQIMHSLESLYW